MNARDRQSEVDAICDAALELQPRERAAFVVSACGGDDELRREVDALLAHAQSAESFLAEPAHLATTARLVGRRIGVYEFGPSLGAGGMGEVYRARDTTLDRDVAIKILPLQFTRNPERLARFEREARLLATLNHPRIGAIYGTLKVDGTHALVLELVEGPTLADQLHAGPLPIDQALRIALQIAEALEAAHTKGIVHRDLKPPNIKVTVDDAVKVIDFGLGKAMDSGVGAAERAVAASPGAHLTRDGSILGTAPYMSPEQVRGRAVDRRTDIWAFGCVLFELLTGRDPFGADTVAETTARILEREPAWEELPPAVPDSLRRLVQRCLRKDPEQRLHDIADARIEIADALSAPAATPGHPRTDTRSRHWRWIAAAGAAIAVAAAAGARLAQPAETTHARLEFRVDVADNAAFGVAVSPDGRRIALARCCGGPQIAIHDLASGQTVPIPLTESGGAPFWAPDASALGFYTRAGNIMRINLAGGPPAIICTVPTIWGASWGTAGEIVFSEESRIFHVPASGGTPAAVALQDGEAPTALRTFPSFLPDGRHFVYFVNGPRGRSVRIGSLDAPQTKALVESDRPAIFAPPSHLLFLRGAALMAARLDARTYDVAEPPVLVAPDVATGYLGSPGTIPLFSASAGVLAYVPTRGGTTGRLRWFDRDGRAANAIEPSAGGEYLNPAISPRGDLVAANRMDPQTGNWSIWVLDMSGRVVTRLTVDSARATDPVWSPDGREIAFVSRQQGQVLLSRKAVDGAEPVRNIAAFDEPVRDLVPTDWSRDGTIIFTREGPPFGLSVWRVPIDGGRPPVRIETGEGQAYGARLSPDGRWIAYASFVTGGSEIFVQRLDGSERRQATHENGTHARWTDDGRELFYIPVPGGVASVALGPHMEIGSARTIVAAPVQTLIDARTHYDVTRDGRRILLREAAGTSRPSATVVVNWAATLKK